MTDGFGNYLSYGYDKIGQLTSGLGYEPNGTARLDEKLLDAYDAAHDLTTRSNNLLRQTFTPDNLNQLGSADRTGHDDGRWKCQYLDHKCQRQRSDGCRLYQRWHLRQGWVHTRQRNEHIHSHRPGQFRTQRVAVSSVYLPSTVSFQYDGNGNLVYNGNRAFAFDDENQLVRVTVTIAWKSEFTYDGKGRHRIANEFTWSSGAWWLQTNEVRYVCSGNLVLQERDGSNAPRVTYTRGSDLSGPCRGLVGLADCWRDTITCPNNLHIMRKASTNDISALVALMGEFYEEASYQLNEQRAAEAFAAILADDRLGGVWIIEADSQAVGHVVMTFCFSMEYGGLVAFVDDLFVRAPFRRSGLGKAALEVVRAFCVERGVRAIQVETGPDNLAAQATYRRAGFTKTDRDFLALRLKDPTHVTEGDPEDSKMGG